MAALWKLRASRRPIAEEPQPTGYSDWLEDRGRSGPVSGERNAHSCRFDNLRIYNYLKSHPQTEVEIFAQHQEARARVVGCGSIACCVSVAVCGWRSLLRFLVEYFLGLLLLLQEKLLTLMEAVRCLDSPRRKREALSLAQTDREPWATQPGC